MTTMMIVSIESMTTPIIKRFCITLVTKKQKNFVLYVCSLQEAVLSIYLKNYIFKVLADMNNLKQATTEQLFVNKN